jgi:hypothetical protein
MVFISHTVPLRKNFHFITKLNVNLTIKFYDNEWVNDDRFITPTSSIFSKRVNKVKTEIFQLEVFDN